MAHLLEHVLFMNNPARVYLSSEGVRSNAYTDFHHTVYRCFSSKGKEVLSNIFRALSDVLRPPKFTSEMLEKEKAAVLSEMSMLNTIDHRLNKKLLSSLHEENLLSSRFPIGNESLLRSWSPDDLITFHKTHYRPGNSVLYVVGDVETDVVERMIQDTLGDVTVSPAFTTDSTSNIMSTAKGRLLSGINRHFPPVLHQWTENSLVNSKINGSKVNMNSNKWKTLQVYQNKLVPHFSFHMMKKRPISPLRSFKDLKNSVLKQIILKAMILRVELQGRNKVLCSDTDVSLLDLPREGCEVCSLDLVSDPDNWRNDVSTTLEELSDMFLKGSTIEF